MSRNILGINLNFNPSKLFLISTVLSVFLAWKVAAHQINFSIGAIWSLIEMLFTFVTYLVSTYHSKIVEGFLHVFNDFKKNVTTDLLMKEEHVSGPVPIYLMVGCY